MPQDTQRVELMPYAGRLDNYLVVLIRRSDQLEQSQARDGSRCQHGLNPEGLLLAPLHHDLFLPHSNVVAILYGRIHHVL